MLDSAFSFRPCTRSTRRNFLAGGFGALALATATARGRSPSEPRARSAILVYLSGGLSHLDSFDPKPDAPSEFRGKYGAIPTSVPGLRIGEKLPMMAKLMNRVALVRSGTHTSDHHETAANQVLSGRLGSAFGDFPAMGAVAARVFGSTPEAPLYFSVPRNPAATWELGKSAFLGRRHESTATGEPANEREPAHVRERYGRGTVGQSMLLARRLVETGARFVTVNCGDWDHHANMFERLDTRLPELDRGLSALIEDLENRGMLANTLLVVMSEFGRTPSINANGGRDHWPAASSILLAGGGVEGGRMIGRTDSRGAFVTDRPVSPADVAHTVYQSLGIDARQKLINRDGRPVAILDEGEPLRELFV